LTEKSSYKTIKAKRRGVKTTSRPATSEISPSPPALHGFTIHFRSYNRTARQMQGRHVQTVSAKTRWSALRAWWRVQRQLQPIVEVLDITLNHQGCPQIQLPTHWVYGCAYAA
jgi:hypothetical protein